MMPGPLAAMILGGLLLATAADDPPPTLNIGPTCARPVSDALSNTEPGQCERSEQEARNKLLVEWAKFRAADRRECLTLTHIGGFPSYVQLLTCLEVARDAREPPGG